ncbi:MAG: protein kinase [Candidatus Cryptobacteroides sp.]
MNESQCPIMPDELEMIHESGYGICVLYKARKDGRIFACKALRPEFRGVPVYEEMMKKDFSIGSSVHHPNICRYYAYVTSPDLGNCVVMEWVDGINLQQYLETNRCTVSKVKEKDRIVCEICAALDHIVPRARSRHRK